MEIVKDSAKYYGQYVSTKSFTSRDVVTFGSSIIDVYNRAKEHGIEDPVITYIQDPNVLNIYQVG